MPEIDSQTKKVILSFQRNEITEYYIYRALARLVRDPQIKEVLRKISDEEMRHYQIWHNYTGRKVKPNSLKRWFYVIIAALFGVTFGIKLMEKGESNAQLAYNEIASVVPDATAIKKEEEEHESQLISLIDEEKLSYLGSVVLGLNDALVEFTGALAGFTFALQNSRLIGLAGVIMGISAAFSMAASEYLSTKMGIGHNNPLRAAFYTGVAYVLTVVVLVSPFFFLDNYYFALLVMLMLAVLLIMIFNFYYSVVRDISFRERFTEMLVISLGVAALSFLVGLIARSILRIGI